MDDENARVSGVGLPHASVTAATATRVGSLIGHTHLTTLVTDSWATGSVTATSFADQFRYVGGLIGGNSGRVGAAYAGVSVTVSDVNSTGLAHAGGLTGTLGSPITASYATGAVSYGSGGSTQGLYGRIGNTPAVNSYWDYQTTTVADDSDATSPEGKSTAQLQAPTAYAGI